VIKVSSDVVVSVYVVTFNRADKLVRCLDSILSQDFLNFEVIVVDNGSTDSTESILKQYRDLYKNFSFILLGENKGACSARNVAIKRSVGKYITGSDDDDEWMPRRLSGLYQAYSSDFSLVFSEDSVITAKGKIKTMSKAAIIRLEDMKFENLIGNQVFSERTKFIEAGLFDESLLAGQDYDMWFRLIECFGNAKNAKCPGQKIYADGNDRITVSMKRKYGYFNFYRKHKLVMNKRQRQYQLLNIKYFCQSKISFTVFVKLLSCNHRYRRLVVFVRRVLFSF
jgi:glycosyltransferase involved in cell wall biosynthesis